MSGHVKKPIVLGAGALLAILAATLFPAVAFAVPGSGEFVSIYSDGGREITELYNLIAKICLGILIIVEGILLVAIIKFRRRGDDEMPVQNHGDLKLEFGWTMAALAVQIWIGVITINVMFSTEVVPDDIELTVEAYAYQWDWQFVYPEYDNLSHRDLVVPAHTNVKLEVTSRDVIHAIFIPDLGVKIDAVPGRFNYWWFRADGPIGQVRASDFPTVGREEFTLPQTRSETIFNGRDATTRTVTGLERTVTFLGPGRPIEEVSPYAAYNAVEYQGTCAELCGFGHWDMYFRTVVMTPSSFQRWVVDMQTTVTEPDPESLYISECANCHGDQGQGAAPNPTLIGADVVTNPERADEHISIVLAGIEGTAMSSFNLLLDDAALAAVVNHERTSWGNEGGEVDADDVARLREELGMPPFPAGGAEPVPTQDLMETGERLYQSCVTCHGAEGRGPNFIPDLAGSEVVLGDSAELAQILIEGRDTQEWPGRKSPVARTMTDFQLAALLTYIRGSFGNEALEVQPFEVEAIRRDLN